MRLMTPAGFKAKGRRCRTVGVVFRAGYVQVLYCLVCPVLTNAVVGAEQTASHDTNVVSETSNKQIRSSADYLDDLITTLRGLTATNVDAAQKQGLSNALHLAEQLRGEATLPEIPIHMMWVLIVLFLAWAGKSTVETWLRHKEARIRSEDARLNAICDMLAKIANAKWNCERLTELVAATVNLVRPDNQNDPRRSDEPDSGHAAKPNRADV